MLDKASAEGEVRGGSVAMEVFVIKPERVTTSPLDVEGIDPNISTDEILQFIAESRALELQTMQITIDLPDAVAAPG